MIVIGMLSALSYTLLAFGLILIIIHYIDKDEGHSPESLHLVLMSAFVVFFAAVACRIFMVSIHYMEALQ